MVDIAMRVVVLLATLFLSFSIVNLSFFISISLFPSFFLSFAAFI
jgi:hypothetical protein